MFCVVHAFLHSATLILTPFRSQNEKQWPPANKKREPPVISDTQPNHFPQHYDLRWMRRTDFVTRGNG